MYGTVRWLDLMHLFVSQSQIRVVLTPFRDVCILVFINDGLTAGLC